MCFPANVRHVKVVYLVILQPGQKIRRLTNPLVVRPSIIVISRVDSW